MVDLCEYGDYPFRKWSSLYLTGKKCIKMVWIISYSEKKNYKWIMPTLRYNCIFELLSKIELVTVSSILYGSFLKKGGKKPNAVR